MFDIFIRALNALLMIAIPLVLGVYLTRKLSVSWRLFGIGAVTFVASQVFHIPFNFLILNPLTEKLGISITQAIGAQLLFVALLYGLSAGVFEEGARYIVYRFWLKQEKERTWRNALMFGAGHGGIEAIITGVLAVVTLIRLLALRDVDLATLVPIEQLGVAKAQVELYWSLPWYGAMLGALERAFAICFHLSATVLVLQAFRRKNILWLGTAIVWHTIFNAFAVFAAKTWGAYAAEALIGILGLLSLAIVFVLREPSEISDKPRPEVAVLSLDEIEVNELSINNLENSRYDGS
jgi:uncharacterized membrane protein YhfC